MSATKRFTNFLQEFSIPLIAGVVVGLVFANIDEHAYHHWAHFPVLGAGAKILGHDVTLHFLINDIFMVFFFGIALRVGSGIGERTPLKRETDF